MVFLSDFWYYWGDLPSSRSRAYVFQIQGRTISCGNWPTGGPCSISEDLMYWVDRSTPPARTLGGSAVLGNNMYIFGGYDGNTLTNDVWRSSDLGASWQQIAPSSPWQARYFIGFCSDGVYMYLHGGNQYAFMDMWRSADGINWELRANNLPMTGRRSPAMVFFQGWLYYMGGLHYSDGYPRGDVWRSSNAGASFSLVTNSAWPAREAHAAVVHRGVMYISGGTNSGSYLNDIWFTPNGVYWTKFAFTTQWSGRAYHNMISGSDQLLVLNGENVYGQQWDLWVLRVEETCAILDYQHCHWRTTCFSAPGMPSELHFGFP